MSRDDDRAFNPGGGDVTALAAGEDSRVVIVTIDGLRWQEMFGGADQAYFKRDAKDVIDPVSKKYSGDTAELRRATLMPFTPLLSHLILAGHWWRSALAVLLLAKPGTCPLRVIWGRI